ncbi:MAG: non-ribosomal peptide synthetase [Pseudooceanicola nanhaiensis]
MTDLTTKLARLTPAQRQLLQKRMAASGATASAIPKRAADGPAPLSFAQRRLWFVQGFDPANTAYNLGTTLHLTGTLDVAAMQSAFAATVARHVALRTRYELGPEGEPRQIEDTGPVLTLTDLSDEPDAAEGLVAQVVGAPHDLTQVPVRAALIRLAPDAHLLTIGIHHIAADRAATGIVIRDLAALYDAACRGARDPLPPLAVQMPDLAAWQTGPRAAEIERKLDWWRAELQDAPVLDLPRARQPRPDRAPAGGFLPLDFDPATVRAARDMARRKGVSLFTLMLAACNVLLSRYCDTDDIVVGADVSNRDRAELQNMVGPLVNTLVLRTRLSPGQDFNAALDATQEVFRAALDNHEVPLERVVEALNPERRPDEMIPLFRAKFDLQRSAPLPDTVHGLTIRREPFRDTDTKYELRFNLEDDGDTLGGRIEYRADLYDAQTVERIALHYRQLLAALLDSPETPVAHAAMLTETERAELLDLSRGPDLPPHAPTLHAAFERQVDATPDAPALSWEGGTFTYGALDARANAVAAELIARDPAPETRVGICMARSPDLVAAILGVLKAGCAYVPLDPNYPAARIGFICEDAGVDLILTDGAPPPFPSGADTLDATGMVPVAERPGSRGASCDLAVVIYTSGSTGTPKGVALDHGNILSRVAWCGTAFDPAYLKGVFFATSVSFDLSLFEIFATLGNGGRMILGETLLDLPRLPDDAGVTLLNTVPSLLRELVKHHDLPGSVRVINLAGEFFPPALLDRLLEFPQRITINNLYGPTEDAIYDAGNPVQDDPERPMPIGRPFPGSRLYILDRNGEPLPKGVAGEICCAGAGLSRGYLNRDALTAERYLPDPFEPGARMYRSGDRGLWREDGRIDIRGRIDTQVKLRGQRIEIGEIENRLEAHPDVAEAAVLVTGEPGDIDRQLVAHVAPPPGATVLAETLRDHLQTVMPRYMVPALWTVHDDLPRMPNGKIDRRALSLAGQPRTVAGAAPRTETERRVTAIWADLVGAEEIGIDDDFFAVGGHSLLAMRLLIRLREEFGVDLQLAQLYRALTPASQAALIDEAETATEAEEDETAGLSDAEVDALLARMTHETSD